MITEITQSNPSQSLIEHDILLQQLQLQQLIILGLVLLVILLIPVAIIMFKRQKQASTYWRSLFQEIEQVNQDVTFRNQTQKPLSLLYASGCKHWKIKNLLNLHTMNTPKS